MKRIKTTQRHDLAQLLTKRAFTNTFVFDLVARRRAGERITEEGLFDELADELEELVGLELFPSFDAFRLHYRRHAQIKKPADLERARRSSKRLRSVRHEKQSIPERKEKEAPAYTWEQLLTRQSFAATFRDQLDHRRQAGEQLKAAELFEEIKGYLLEHVDACCFLTYDAFRAYRYREDQTRRKAGPGRQISKGMITNR